MSSGQAPARTAAAAVTLRLLPFLFVLYVVCFLDRVNIGFAALQMNHDFVFSPAVYGFGAHPRGLGHRFLISRVRTPAPRRSRVALHPPSP
jgi:hypothetical protein